MGQLSTLGEAGKASTSPLLSIRPHYGDDCHQDNESNQGTQPCKEDLVIHGFPSLWPFLIESAFLIGLLRCRHCAAILENSDQRFLVPREGLTRSVDNFANENSAVIWAFDPKLASREAG